MNKHAESFKKNEKPVAKIIGEDGNVYNLLSICKRALKNYEGAFDELYRRVIKSESYYEALNIMMEYINPLWFFNYYKILILKISIRE